MLKLLFWTQLTSEPSKQAAVLQSSQLLHEMSWCLVQPEVLQVGCSAGERMTCTEQVLQIEQSLLTDNHLFLFFFSIRGRGGNVSENYFFPHDQTLPCNLSHLRECEWILRLWMLALSARVQKVILLCLMQKSEKREEMLNWTVWFILAFCSVYQKEGKEKRAI